MNKVLIVTYYWPPSGGAGVQRWLKFSGFLPQFGWEPVILTVDPVYATYPFTDDSLVSSVPENIKIHKTPAVDYFRLYLKDKSAIPSAGFASGNNNSLKGKISRFIRGNFFIPDPRRGWNKYALRKACEVINNEKINHIITTSPPHSTQLIGLKLKKKYPGIRWIADLRDPWTDIYYYSRFYPTFISKMIDQGYETSVLAQADRIITVGPSLKDLFSSKVRGTGDKTDIITNGYNEADFENIKTGEPERLTITYVGTLSEAYPVSGLVSALKKIQNEGTEFILRFTGKVSEKTRQEIIAETGSAFIDFIPYTDHKTALTYMVSSTVLLLIIPEQKNNKCIITGKLFEYLAAGRPILCIGPSDGDAAKIIDICKAGKTVGYRNSVEISSFLSNVTVYASMINRNAVKKYSRSNLTKQITKTLES